MTAPRKHRAEGRAAARLRRAGAGLVMCVALAAGWVAADPMPFRVYPAAEYPDPYELPRPRDFNKRSEWTIGRLMFPSVREPFVWQHGYTDWTIDYPKEIGRASCRERVEVRVVAVGGDRKNSTGEECKECMC